MGGDAGGMKKGGKIKRRKRGGMVPGKEPAPRLDKRARGGGVATPKSPLSGADAPNLSYAKSNITSNTEGAGKDRTKYRGTKTGG